MININPKIKTKMKKLLAIVMMVLPMLVGAQTGNDVWFEMQPDGSFLTKDGKEYVVVEYDGKTAHELYQMIAANIGSVYNDPSQVMSGVEDVSIKVRAIYPNILTKKLIFNFDGRAYYQIEFKFKDGKIRIDAPYIEETVIFDTQPPKSDNFYRIISKWYNKGELKDKNKVEYNVLNIKVNTPIRLILNPSGSDQKENDNWESPLARFGAPFVFV